MISQQQDIKKMATITTISVKQYEFCDEIKQHILSYITGPKMEPFDLMKNQSFVYSFWSRNPTLKTLIYRFRLRMSRRQLMYELSAKGHAERWEVAKQQKNTLFMDLLYWPYYDELTLNLKNANFTKAKFLDEIIFKGTQSTKALRSKLRKRERVNCEFCGKELARASMKRHLLLHN